MTSLPLDRAVTVIESCLEHMRLAYESGLELVTQIETATSPEDELPTLQQLFNLVQDVETSARKLQQADWPGPEQLSKEPWSRFVAMRDQAATLAHTLITRVDEALEIRRAKLAQLAPQLDEELNRRRMKAAYGAVSDGSNWQALTPRSEIA